ncbi:hypothetical protein DICVIV_03149 [Dictyocaulus viviparus]|uniref:Uncharacterized protein n=1 Tax=Dictyocaulus viviparus TaxID=29172 RepID=A0A0D8Y3Z8_DICVI|nr:hypothetical protein DICVIV_03149 [Dictyocaulus viviparus]
MDRVSASWISSCATESIQSLFGNYLNDVHINITIYDAECYSASTHSTFDVILVGLDFHNRPTTSHRFHSSDFKYERRGKLRKLNTIRNIASDDSMRVCLAERTDCLVRADMVVINFDSTPDDPWAIDQIDVDVYFMLGSARSQWHMWHFEHSVLRPCISWLSNRKTYQIGPRNGLFIEHPYGKSFNSRTFVRDWV